jgi:hypothetical protein
MVPLACELSPFEARVLAARLGAEGVVWELRGGSSVYPVGWVDVLVSADDLDHATELLLIDEIEAAFDDDWVDGDGDDTAPMATPLGTRRRVGYALIVAGMLVCGWFLTYRPWLG